MVKLLTQNSKIRKSTGARVFNFGIPAFKSKSGFRTCPNAAACAVGCYAQSGAYLFSNVAQAFERRLSLIRSTPDFEVQVLEELISNNVERLRIHDSGDFFSAAYYLRWRLIMNAMPHVEFYAYTKQVAMFNNLKQRGLIPQNFTVIFSYGGKEDKLIDRARDRHASVFETLDELQRAGYSDASDDDSVALGENPRIGLIYHGNKSFNNTHWDRVKTGGDL